MDFCIVDDIAMEDFQDVYTSEGAILIEPKPIVQPEPIVRPEPIIQLAARTQPAPILHPIRLNTNNQYEEIPLSDTDKDCTRVETVIVGGGVSGLYCAWKMLKKDGKKDLLLIEQSDNLGGRLQTDIIKFSDDTSKCLKEEEGGMRFSGDDQVMVKLWKLIKELDIQKDKNGTIIDFKMTPNGFNSNRNRFNGNNFTMWYAKENPIVWSTIFDLNKDEMSKSPGDIVKEIFKRILDHNFNKLLYYIEQKHGWGREELDIILSQDQIKDKDPNLIFVNRAQDPEYWQYVRNNFTWGVDGNDIQLNMMSMTTLMVEMGYSYGCIMMLTQGLGFICTTLTQGNAGVVLQMLVTNTNIDPSLKCFQNGFTVLTKKLEKEIDNIINLRAGEKKWKVLSTNNKWKMLSTMVTNLICINESKVQNGYKYRLDVTASANRNCEPGVPPRPTNSIQAKNVILAIAQDSIIDLFTTFTYPNPKDKVPIMTPLATTAINSVTGIQMVKINIFFDREWWNEGLNEWRKLYGPNTTNLALAFVYPFYSFRCTEDDPKSKWPAALTIYCDRKNAIFWSELQSIGLLFKSDLQDKYQNMDPVSRPLLKEALRQLGLLFNQPNVPQPILTSFKNWNGTWGESNKDGCKKYNGFGIHQWRVGVDDKMMIKNMIQPFVGQDIFCCNESWSDFQGWVEGALRSSDLVLEEFGILDE